MEEALEVHPFLKTYFLFWTTCLTVGIVLATYWMVFAVLFLVLYTWVLFRGNLRKRLTCLLLFLSCEGMWDKNLCLILFPHKQHWINLWQFQYLGFLELLVYFHVLEILILFISWFCIYFCSLLTRNFIVKYLAHF